MLLRSSRTLAPALLAVAAVAVTTALVAPTAPALGLTDTPTVSAARRAPATVTIRPDNLDRGRGPAVAQVIGTTIVHRGLRIDTDAQEVQLYGRSDGDYVIGVWDNNGNDRVERVSKDGTRETILDRVRSPVLSRDGRQLFEAVVHRNATTVITVRDAVTGERTARRTFRGYVRVLDADAGRAVLGGSSPGRAFWWTTATDTRSRIVSSEGYFADIRADRVATFPAGGDQESCSVLTALSAPRTTVWRSCRQAVAASSPNGRRLLTIYIYGDGPTGHVEVHAGRGRHLATYRTRGFFGPFAWENDRDALLPTYAANGGRVTLVRCRLDNCVRASAHIAS